MMSAGELYERRTEYSELGRKRGAVVSLRQRAQDLSIVVTSAGRVGGKRAAANMTAAQRKARAIKASKAAAAVRAKKKNAKKARE